LDLIPESQIDVAIKQGKLINPGKLILSRAVTCTTPGVFKINCTNYKLCYDVGAGNILGAEGTCAPDNYNPSTQSCDSSYVCPQCTAAGFTCLTNTTFIYCSDVLEIIVENVMCPADHYCNRVCKLPCTKLIQNC
jgi:hypothetical protein